MQVIGEFLIGHTDLIASLAWFPDGSRLVSSSADFTIRVWNISAEVNKDTEVYQSGPKFAHQSAYKIDDEGWLRDDSGVVLWLPPDYRSGYRDRSIYTIPDTGPNRKVTLDWSDFRNRDVWEEVQLIENV